MKKYFIPLLSLLVFTVFGCQKEFSEEQGNIPAEGSLQEVGGDCLPKTVNGAYVVGTPLASGNTIQVTVNVTKMGRYEIITDTVNGYYFRGAGLFTVLGANQVTLLGNGTPFVSRTDNFIVSFDSTFCNLQVDVLPAGSGPATFTLVNGGTPANCASAVVAGTYANGSVLGASNYVDITVNVTAVGSYTISATGGGMTFAKTGAFTTTGNQTVRLQGTGTPTTAGANTITFAAPLSACNFTVTVDAPAAFTATCGGATVNGTCTAGTALTTSNTITIPVTVTTAGAYNITASINGMTFSGSGTLTTTSTSITLNGSGTPTASGTHNLSVLSCTIPIVVQPGAVTINWKFNIGTTVYQGQTDQVDFDNTTAPPFTLLDYYGVNTAPGDFNITMLDITGGITTTDTYNTNVITLSNGGYFSYVDATVDLEATDPTTTPGVNIVIKITSHNTATRTVVGTFSGTALDHISNTTKTITGGQFTAVY